MKHLEFDGIPQSIPGSREDTIHGEMEKKIDSFAVNLKPGDVGLFYYAGHGIQIEGENFLIPVDFVLKDEADTKYSSYSASRLHDRMEKAGTGLNIIILDACRNNPFLSARSTSRGLALMRSGEGTFIAFATAPGKTASDNPRGVNGLFTNYLLEALKEPGLNLDQVFSRVRERVALASNRKQIPWTASSVIGEFYFNESQLPKSVPPNTVAHTVDVSNPPDTTEVKLALAVKPLQTLPRHERGVSSIALSADERRRS
jgi:uncharacterized caspase-like protein